MEHTPLPWVLDGNEIVAVDKRDRHGDIVIATLESWTAEYAGEQEANGRLIVRACNSHNDLLEALLALVGPDGDLFSDEAHAKAHAAIAKAQEV